MGRSSRVRPKHFAKKLRDIRVRLALSQTEIAEKLSDRRASVIKQDISSFEADTREPTLTILLRYARLGGVSVEALIDEDLDLH